MKISGSDNRYANIHILTINVPLILKVRNIIFFVGKTYNGAFHGVFREGQDLSDL